MVLVERRVCSQHLGKNPSIPEIYNPTVFDNDKVDIEVDSKQVRCFYLSFDSYIYVVMLSTESCKEQFMNVYSLHLYCTGMQIMSVV